MSAKFETLWCDFGRHRFVTEIHPGTKPRVCPEHRPEADARAKKQWAERNRKKLRAKNAQYRADVKAGKRIPRKYDKPNVGERLAVLPEHAIRMKRSEVVTVHDLQWAGPEKFARLVNQLTGAV